MMVAAVHALIFALIFVLTNQWVWKNTHSLFEGATTMGTEAGAKPVAAKQANPAALKAEAKPAVATKGVYTHMGTGAKPMM